MIGYSLDASCLIGEVVAQGRITRAELDTVFDRLRADIDRLGPLKVLEVIQSFEGVELSALLRDLQVGPALIGRVSHAALVTDIGWIGAATHLVAPFLPPKVKVFPLAERAEARAWLAAV